MVTDYIYQILFIVIIILDPVKDHDYNDKVSEKDPQRSTHLYNQITPNALEFCWYSNETGKQEQVILFHQRNDI